MIFKSTKILTERKYDKSDSSLSSGCDAFEFDLEVEESWRVRLANFITEIHAYADELLAEEEWLKVTKAKRKKTRNKRTTFKEDLTPQYKWIHCELRDYSAAHSCSSENCKQTRFDMTPLFVTIPQIVRIHHIFRG